MQSFKRGLPMLPAGAYEVADTEIDAGHFFGLRRWVRTWDGLDLFLLFYFAMFRMFSA